MDSRKFWLKGERIRRILAILVDRSTGVTLGTGGNLPRFTPYHKADLDADCFHYYLLDGTFYVALGCLRVQMFYTRKREVNAPYFSMIMNCSPQILREKGSITYCSPIGR